MKLFVDDERQPPDGTWTVVRTAPAAIREMVSTVGYVEALSLDHDLGEDLSGYNVAAWLESNVHMYGMIPPKLLKVHSANPVGRARILQAFQSIVRYCEQNGIEIPKIEG